MTDSNLKAVSVQEFASTTDTQFQHHVDHTLKSVEVPEWKEIVSLLIREMTGPVRALARDLNNLKHEGLGDTETTDECLEALARLQRLQSQLERLESMMEADDDAEPASVSESICSVAASSQLAAALHGVDVVVEGTDGAGPPTASADVMDELLKLMVADALRYSDAGGRVLLSSSRGRDGGAIVRVRGASAPVPRPLTVGLAIARAVTAKCGGTLALTPGGSVLRLPPAD